MADILPQVGLDDQHDEIDYSFEDDGHEEAHGDDFDFDLDDGEEALQNDVAMGISYKEDGSLEEHAAPSGLDDAGKDKSEHELAATEAVAAAEVDEIDYDHDDEAVAASISGLSRSRDLSVSTSVVDHTKGGEESDVDEIGYEDEYEDIGDHATGAQATVTEVQEHEHEGVTAAEQHGAEHEDFDFSLQDAPEDAKPPEEASNLDASHGVSEFGDRDAADDASHPAGDSNMDEHLGEAADETSSGLDHVGMPHTAPLPDVTVTWADETCPLFKTSASDDPTSYYLEDAAVIEAPLSQFLSTVKSSIVEWLKADDEICICIDELGLEFAETTTGALISHVTFGNLLALYDALAKNDGLYESRGIHLTLTTRPSCALRLRDLAQGAQSGKGLSSFHYDEDESEDVSPSHGELVDESSESRKPRSAVSPAADEGLATSNGELAGSATATVFHGESAGSSGDGAVEELEGKTPVLSAEQTPNRAADEATAETAGEVEGLEEVDYTNEHFGDAELAEEPTAAVAAEEELDLIGYSNETHAGESAQGEAAGSFDFNEPQVEQMEEAGHPQGVAGGGDGGDGEFHDADDLLSYDDDFGNAYEEQHENAVGQETNGGDVGEAPEYTEELHDMGGDPGQAQDGSFAQFPSSKPLTASCLNPLDEMDSGFFEYDETIGEVQKGHPFRLAPTDSSGSKMSMDSGVSFTCSQTSLANFAADLDHEMDYLDPDHGVDLVNPDHPDHPDHPEDSHGADEAEEEYLDLGAGAEVPDSLAHGGDIDVDAAPAVTSHDAQSSGGGQGPSSHESNATTATLDGDEIDYDDEEPTEAYYTTKPASGAAQGSHNDDEIDWDDEDKVLPPTVTTSPPTTGSGKRTRDETDAGLGDLPETKRQRS